MIIEMKDIYKSFGKNDVLKGVDFNLGQGEIHALVGENGAGKSTLMNILSGVLNKDSGKILIDGKEVDIIDTNVAKEYGISFIHQELSDWPELSVMDNIFMNNELGKGLFLDKKTMREKCVDLLDRFDLNINPDTKVSNLSVGQRQMMEIAKANLNKVNVLILDEPTSALTNNEIEKLFQLINKLRDEDVSMIYISHRMEEIFALTDKITVMRDGKSVAVMNTSETSEKEVVSHMVGRDIGDFYPEMDAEVSDVKIELKNFSREGYFEDINIAAKKGEVLGISGLMGAGRTEIMRAVYGLDPKDSGEIYIDGKKVEITKPIEAINNKIGFVTENRQEEGLVLDESIRENISLLNFWRNLHVEIFQSGYTNLHSHQQCIRVSFSLYSHQYLLFLVETAFLSRKDIFFNFLKQLLRKYHIIKMIVTLLYLCCAKDLYDNWIKMKESWGPWWLSQLSVYLQLWS